MSYNLRTSSDNKEIITISSSSSNATNLGDDSSNKIGLRKRQNSTDSKLKTSKKTLQKSTSRSRSSSKSPSRQKTAAVATKRKSPTRIAKSSRVVTKRELDDAKKVDVKSSSPDIIEITTTTTTTTTSSGGGSASRRTRSRSSTTNRDQEGDNKNQLNTSTESSQTKVPRESIERLKNEIAKLTSVETFFDRGDHEKGVSASGAATRVLNALENNLNLIDSPAVIQSSSLQQTNNPHRYDLRLRANNTPTKSIQQQAPVHNSTPHTTTSRSSIVIESKKKSPGGSIVTNSQQSTDHHDGPNNKSMFKYSGYLRYTNRNLLQIFIASVILILVLIFASGYYHEQITESYTKGKQLFKESIEKTRRYLFSAKQ